MKTVVIVNSINAVSYFRQILPTWEINRNGYFINMMLITDISLESLSPYEVIHFHANLLTYEPFRLIFNGLRELGIKMIMDIDDFWMLPKTNPYYEVHKLKDYVSEYFPKMDCITTTTNRFKNELRKVFKGNIIVLPNATDKQNPQFIPKRTKSHLFRIGIIGGASHLDDLEVLKGFQNYLDMSDKQIVLCGFNIEGVYCPQLSIWNNFELLLTNNYKDLPLDYVNYLMRYSQQEYPLINNMPYKRNYSRDIESYASFYNEVDVLLAPLQNNRFNSMKSELKGIEAGTMGVPMICSNVAPYNDAFTKDEVIFVNNGAKNWADGITKVIKQYDKYRDNLIKVIDTKYNLRTINEKRIDLYESI
jgi:hypothetical protein